MSRTWAELLLSQSMPPLIGKTLIYILTTDTSLYNSGIFRLEVLSVLVTFSPNKVEVKNQFCQPKSEVTHPKLAEAGSSSSRPFAEISLSVISRPDSMVLYSYSSN